MKYYDIHTHKSVDASTASDCVLIHNLSQSGMQTDIDVSIANQYYSCGIHPWDVFTSKIGMGDVHRLLGTTHKVVAIGECGLDKLIDTPLQLQLKVFEEHILLSEKLEMPLIIHCVKAWNELIQMYKKHKPQSSWILHGYRGGEKQTEQLLKFGLYFSLGEFFNNETLKLIYPHRLLLETDESYISIEDVYRQIGNVLNVKEGEVGSVVEQNVNKLFCL